MQAPEPGLTAEINVTPMIDVLLVLLVIFMLAPRTRTLVPVNVPPQRGPSGRGVPQIVLELRVDRSYAINGATTVKEELGRKLAQIYAGRPQKILFIRAEPGWRYGEVIEAADIARGAGVQVIGYVPHSDSARRPLSEEGRDPGAESLQQKGNRGPEGCRDENDHDPVVGREIDVDRIVDESDDGEAHKEEREDQRMQRPLLNEAEGRDESRHDRGDAC